MEFGSYAWEIKPDYSIRFAVGIGVFIIFINIVVRDMFLINDMTRLTLTHEFTFIIVLFNKYHSNYSGISNSIQPYPKS